MEGSAIWRVTLEKIFEAVRLKESDKEDYYWLLQTILRENPRWFSSWLERPMFVMEHDEKLLLDKIHNQENAIQVSVIPVVGVCGSGKTTLARRVYEHSDVKDEFEVRAWVQVYGGEVKPRQAAQGILKSVMGMSCSLDDLDELDEMVRDTLHFQKCLIVFDGVESMSNDSWLHMIKHWFDFVGLGSVVLITTCHEEVAYVVDHQPFELTALSPAAAWTIFKNDANHGFTDLATSLVAKNVATLCRGNPLSLGLLGSLMRSHKELQEVLSSVDLSNHMSQPTPDASALILLCVWALPEHLRHLIACCSTYPKGYPLNKQKIAGMLFEHFDHDQYDDYWVDGSYSVVDICVDQLVKRSFFTDITFNKNYESRNYETWSLLERGMYEIMEFRMPGFIREIGQDVAKHVFEVKVGTIGSIGEDAGTISLIQQYNPHGLKGLILSPTIYLGGVLDHSFAEFTDLQSLDLSCTGIRTLPADICALRELRYLNLSYSLIEKLPDSVTELSRLQTLDLSWCYHLKVLPEKIHKFWELVNLDLSRCESLSNLPSGIADLRYLTSLPLFVLGKARYGACLKDLRELHHLRGRLEIRNLENVREIKEAEGALTHKYLDHLVLSWSSDKADYCSEMLELLKPRVDLKVLELTGYMGFRFPQWISSMKRLIKISISGCNCEELPSLGQMYLLEELQLRGMRYIEQIGPEFYGDGSDDIFPSLQKLGIYDFPRLLEWSSIHIPDSKIQFSSLQTLTVEGCPQLRGIPSNFLHVHRLTVRNSNSQILDSLTASQRCFSVLIKDMKLGMSSNGLGQFISLKTLTLFNIIDELMDDRLVELVKLRSLEHLGILNCHQLRVISWPANSSLRLRKVHISDCQNLHYISVPTTIHELVVEDCPQASIIVQVGNFGSLKKLIIKDCSEFDMGYEDIKYLTKLVCLVITGCPKLEKRLQEEPSLISDIPFVIQGNQKISAPTLTEREKQEKTEWKMKRRSSGSLPS